MAITTVLTVVVLDVLEGNSTRISIRGILVVIELSTPSSADVTQICVVLSGP
jgi:hypothetical protein